MSLKSLESVSSLLLSWYEEHQRSFPWRLVFSSSESPPTTLGTPEYLYTVWISEIMLQQTTTQTVVPYFHRFLEAFPSLVKLAQSSEEEVLYLWQGLGYYSRGRRLHEASKIINIQGFPRTYEEWLKIPGVGPYTAGALCSIGYNQSILALDGHGWRLFSRLFQCQGETWKKDVLVYAQQALPTHHCWAYTQSIMDFGQLVCKAKDPLCSQCPLRSFCKAFQEKTWHLYPPKVEKKEKPKYYTLGTFYENPQGEILLKKNSKENLLKGLWSLPFEPWITEPSNSWLERKLPYVHHHFTHFHGHCYLQHIFLSPEEIKNHKNSATKQWIKKEDLLDGQGKNLPPLSTFAKKMLKKKFLEPVFIF